MSFVAGIIGYLIGSVPTANGLARLWGVDLRTTGTANPGANNARRAGGMGLAGLVLVVEIGKGLLAVVIGIGLAGDIGGVVAGIGAAGGNVYNLWYRFSGGKGLGISTGVVIGLWPTVIPILLAVIIVAALITRSSGIAAVIVLATTIGLSFAWAAFDWKMAWGITRLELVPVLAIGLTAILGPKHWKDAVGAIRRSSRP